MGLLLWWWRSLPYRFHIGSGCLRLLSLLLVLLSLVSGLSGLLLVSSSVLWQEGVVGGGVGVVVVSAVVGSGRRKYGLSCRKRRIVTIYHVT